MARTFSNVFQSGGANVGLYIYFSSILFLFFKKYIFFLESEGVSSPTHPICCYFRSSEIGRIWIWCNGTIIYMLDRQTGQAGWINIGIVGLFVGKKYR